MRLTLWFSFIFFIILQSSQVCADCDPLPQPTEFKKISDTSYLIVWELTSFGRDEIAETIYSEAFISHQNTLLNFIKNIEPFHLLKRQRGLYKKNGFENELIFFDAILSKKLGKITPINCFESLLLDQHLKLGSEHHESEFSAFVLLLGYKVKIYFLSGNQISPPSFKNISEILNKNILSGWQFMLHLHNHPFIFVEPDPLSKDFGGTTIPSNSDRESYKIWKNMYGLFQARITNGFHTIQITEEEFERF